MSTYIKLTEAEKAARVEARRKERAEAKALSRYNEVLNSPDVDFIDMTIIWKKSRTWGHVPHITARAYYLGNFVDRYESSASGFGYDKESQVIANVFNYFLKKRLISGKTNGPRPYGIYTATAPDLPFFDGGIGSECYRAISEYIGGEFKHTYSNNLSDGFTFTSF